MLLYLLVLSASYTVTESSFNQSRTHFHVPYYQKGFFKQRYWQISDYWKKDNPIFLYLCGQYQCPGYPQSRQAPLQLAEQLQSLMLVLQHRYYGQSIPYSYSNKFLQLFQYLSVQQALADIAYFIRHMNKELNFTGKWVVVGGSYAGGLSAFFRTRYPDLVVGAWASSAVINPYSDFPQFDQQVYLSAMMSGADCVEAIRHINEETEAAYLNKTTEIITDYFNATEEFAGDSDKRTVLFYVTDLMAELIQYGHRTSLCEKITKSTDIHQQLKELSELSYQAGLSDPQFYSLKSLKSTEVEFSKLGRQWYWQKCTQMGWFQTPSQYKMRSELLNIEYWTSFCNQIFSYFGNLPTPDLSYSRIQLNYKGTNIIYSNGQEDPWKWAGIQVADPSYSYIPIQCTDCGHCVDLYTPQSTDSDALKEARTQIYKTIESWLAD